MGPRIVLSKQLVDLLSSHSDCSLHEGAELQAVLGSDEGDAVFVAVKGLQGVAHVQDFAESTRPCERLEATPNEGICQVGAVRIEAAFENAILVLRLHLEHLAHQVDQIILLLIVVFFEKGGFPGSKPISTLEEEHDSARLILRRQVNCHVYWVLTGEEAIATCVMLSISVSPPKGFLSDNETLLAAGSHLIVDNESFGLRDVFKGNVS